MHTSVYEFVKSLGLKGKTLDVGSYDVNGSVKDLFTEYIGVDMREGPNVDIVATADDLPFSDETFDNVVCLEVFEHDKRFWKSIIEMHRVLKAGGTLVITARGISFPKHDYPYDLFRFTIEGLHTLFETVDFTNIKVFDDPQASGVFGIGKKKM